jgi:hypothetical protein
MRLHHPGQWFFFSPEKFYFSSCDSVILGVRSMKYIAQANFKTFLIDGCIKKIGLQMEILPLDPSKHEDV